MSEKKIIAYELSIKIKPDDITVSSTDKNEQKIIDNKIIESAFLTDTYYILKDMDLSKTNIPLRNFKSSTGLLKALGDMYLPPDVLDKEKYDYENGKKKQNRIVVNNINFLLGKIFDSSKEVSIKGVKTKYTPNEVRWDETYKEDLYNIKIKIGIGIVSSSGSTIIDSMRGFCSKNNNAVKKMFKNLTGKNPIDIESFGNDNNKSVVKVSFKGGKSPKTKKRKTKYNKKNRRNNKKNKSKKTTIKKKK
jgi:hypothetical protein